MWATACVMVPPGECYQVRVGAAEALHFITGESSQSVFVTAAAADPGGLRHCSTAPSAIAPPVAHGEYVIKCRYSSKRARKKL